MPVRVRPVTPTDREVIKGILLESWGSERVVAHGTVYRPLDLPGFVAEIDDEPVGAVTYVVDRDACEIVTIDARREGIGVGTALLDAVTSTARRAGCTRLWLITTNDNEHAKGWYRRRGFSLVAVHAGAVDRSRELKPEIPSTDERGVPIRDELEFERAL